MFWDIMDRISESRPMLALISVVDWLGTRISDFELFIAFAAIAWIVTLFLAFGGKR